ncbi:uncharacterized protein LOC119396682 [Rhipicephalus sanguineus]|uniref:uncharacterized protein LOC119396682 n=1 Tax=Rhipicephalus sanguineus TaxID=34632 RepID=UPI0018944781|nr:uncharacterized protein LOC119396682 [Rhipicephalus sanguineus]
MGRDASAKRFDVSLKLKVLAYYDQVRNKYKAAKMFGVSECSVRNWIKEEHRLRALSSQGGSNGVRKTPNRAAETRALFEACLERYVQDCQQRGVKARYRDLLAHAAQLKKVHGVRGLKLSIDWVARFVRERKLVGKCERLPKHAGTASPANNSAGSAAARKKGVPPAASCGSRCAKGLPPAKHNAARSLVKRAMGQLSSKAGKTTSPTTAKRKAPTTAHTKAKLKSKAVSSKASKGSDGKVTKALSKNKPTKKATKTGSELKKTVLTKVKKAANKTKTKLAAAAKRGPNTKSKLPPVKKTKTQRAKSAAIVAKYKKCLLKKASQKQKLGKLKNTVTLKKKVRKEAKSLKHKQKVVRKSDKVVKASKGKQCSKAEHNVVVAKKMKIEKEKNIKPEKKVMTINKVVSKSLKKAKETVNRAKKPADKASSPSKQSVQKVKKLPTKNTRPKRQPIKVFRTRYRIKEMHRRIEENRSSDFFDFFYGLGLIPINRDADGTNSLYIPFIPGSPKIYDNTKYLCNKESPLRSSTSDLSNCQPSPHTQLPSKYPIWTPVRTSTIHDPCSSQSGNPWRTSPRAREEHIITDRFTQSKSPEDAVFAEKFHKASLKSEAALSPGESPITPEQLAVVRKLFPPIGSLTFPSQRRAPDSQVTFNEPLKASERSLRPRTSEQTQRLSLCFRKRHYQKRKRTLSEPSRSPERRPNGPSVSDIDWLSADGFPSSAKKSCPGGSSPVYSFGETRHCFRKEHFEDSACPPHMPTSGICGNSPRTAVCTPSNDRPASCLFDSAKHVGRAMPASPKATSSSEGKDLFFGQANRLATLRKKQDRNEPVMHNAKGHQD